MTTKNRQLKAVTNGTPAKKLNHKEFVERAIKTLRKPPHKGIHVVYSGFNAAFREYFGEEPRAIVDQLQEQGFLSVRPIRGGAMMMLAEDEKTPVKTTSATLEKILSQP